MSLLPFRRRVLLAVVGIVLVLVAVWMVRRSRGALPSGELHGASVNVMHGVGLAVSPDGRRVAFVSATGELCLQSSDQPTPKCRTDIRGASSPFFSPDGRWIAFAAADELRKAPVDGGAVQRICDALDVRDASWDYDPTVPQLGRVGAVLFSTPEGIWRLTEDVARPTLVIPTRPGDGPYGSPSMLPSGEDVLFVVAPLGAGGGSGMIVTQSIVTGRRTSIMPGSRPTFDVATGRIVYSTNGQILAQPFVPSTSVTTDVAATLVDHVRVLATGGAQFALSRQGTMVYLDDAAPSAPPRTLLWVDRAGTATPIPTPERSFSAPRISPDGRTIAVTIDDVVSSVWTVDVATGTAARLETPCGPLGPAAWFPDGRRVAVSGLWCVPDGGPVADKGMSPAVWSVNMAGNESAALIWRGPTSENLQPPLLGGLSGDGRVLVGSRSGHSWMLQSPEPLLMTAPTSLRAATFAGATAERSQVVSPDGRWLAYVDTDGLWMRSLFAGRQARRITDDPAATEPAWSHNGRELYFRSADSVMAIPVDADPTRMTASARRLFRGAFVAADGGARNFDVTADGQHFVMVGAPSRDIPTSRIHIVRGWPAQLAPRP